MEIVLLQNVQSHSIPVLKRSTVDTATLLLYQLDKILEFLPAARQTLMFSATFSPEILKLSKKYLQDPERILHKQKNYITVYLGSDRVTTV